MKLKNVIAYRLTQPARLFIDAIVEASNKHEFKPLSDHQPKGTGFVSLMPGHIKEPFAELSGLFFVKVKVSERKIPRKAAQEIADNRVALIKSATKRNVHQKERLQILDEVYAELTPKTPPTSETFVLCIDPELNLILVGASSAAVAEDILSSIRAWIGSLPVEPLQPESSPRIVLTNWLKTSPPANVIILDEATFKYFDHGGATAALKNQDLTSPVIEAMIEEGMDVQSIRVSINEMDVTLNADGNAFKRIILPDEEADYDDDLERADADAFLFKTHFRTAYKILDKAWGWPKQEFIDYREGAA